MYDFTVIIKVQVFDGGLHHVNTTDEAAVDWLMSYDTRQMR